MKRPDAETRRRLLRKHLTGPWKSYVLESVTGLACGALSPTAPLARAYVARFLEDITVEGWPHVRIHDPDKFLNMLRVMHDNYARDPKLLDELRRRLRPNMGVMRSAVCALDALSFHMNLHNALFWRGPVAAVNDQNRLMCDELLKAADCCDIAQRKAYDAALRIGGVRALEDVVADMNRGVFRPVEAP